MPYIDPKRRVDSSNEMFIHINNVGELNYVVTCICNSWIHKNGLSYKTINDIIGVLECAKQEFYRRVAVPYEEDKCMENGDVYNFILDNKK